MEKKIYYHDTDAGGVVYYANYLKYMEEARTEFLIQRGIKPQGEFLYAVRECNTVYKAPARYGDVIRCDTDLLKITAAQLVFQQTIRRVRDEQLLVRAKVTLVSLTSEFRPVAIPDEIRQKLV